MLQAFPQASLAPQAKTRFLRKHNTHLPARQAALESPVQPSLTSFTASANLHSSAEPSPPNARSSYIQQQASSLTVANTKDNTVCSDMLCADPQQTQDAPSSTDRPSAAAAVNPSEDLVRETVVLSDQQAVSPVATVGAEEHAQLGAAAMQAEQPDMLCASQPSAPDHTPSPVPGVLSQREVMSETNQASLSMEASHSLADASHDVTYNHQSEDSHAMPLATSSDQRAGSQNVSMGISNPQPPWGDPSPVVEAAARPEDSVRHSLEDLTMPNAAVTAYALNGLPGAINTMKNKSFSWRKFGRSWHRGKRHI